MLEWLKRHAWKACIPLKGIGGSNPPLSAERAGQKWPVNGQNETASFLLFQSPLSETSKVPKKTKFHY